MPADVATPIGSFPLGSFGIELIVTDPGGLSSQPAHGLVEIVDTTPPALTLNGPYEMTLECHVDTYTELGANATDICDASGNITEVVVPVTVPH